MVGAGVAMWVTAVVAWVLISLASSLAKRASTQHGGSELPSLVVRLWVGAYSVAGAFLIQFGASSSASPFATVGGLVAIALAMTYLGTVHNSMDFQARYVALGILAAGLVIAGTK